MKVLIACAVLGAIGFAVGREYYKAVRHELYQVWDSIDELRGG